MHGSVSHCGTSRQSQCTLFRLRFLGASGLAPSGVASVILAVRSPEKNHLDASLTKWRYLESCASVYGTDASPSMARTLKFLGRQVAHELIIPPSQNDPDKQSASEVPPVHPLRTIRFQCSLTQHRRSPYVQPKRSSSGQSTGCEPSSVPL